MGIGKYEERGHAASDTNGNYDANNTFKVKVYNVSDYIIDQITVKSSCTNKSITRETNLTGFLLKSYANWFLQYDCTYHFSGKAARAGRKKVKSIDLYMSKELEKTEKLISKCEVSIEGGLHERPTFHSNMYCNPSIFDGVDL